MLCQSGGEKDAMAQKIEAGAAGYRARDQVEVGDVALGPSLAPARRERGAHGHPVLLGTRREGLDGRHAASTGFAQPRIKISAETRMTFTAADPAPRPGAPVRPPRQRSQRSPLAASR